MSQGEKLVRHARKDVWIPTLNGDPTPPRRRVLTPVQEKLLQEQTNQWLIDQVIETTNKAPYDNNIVLVAKKDGRTRVCVDCTPVNAVTQELVWPLPRLQDLRHFVKGATCFTRLDLKDAFFRIKVPPAYRQYTAFRVNGKHYQFRRMPFGLTTAPSTFQRFMDWGLAEFRAWCLVYIDDVLITAANKRELAYRVSIVSARIKQMGSTINTNKSEYDATSLLFAGLWINARGIGPNETKKKQLMSLPIPGNKAEIQSALGLVSYLRDFIPLVSHFTAQLYPTKEGLRLSVKEVEIEWRKLMRHVSNSCTLNHHLRADQPISLYTDASQYALGVVLIQDSRLVAVASRKLTPAETRYSATDREHLGLVYAADKFRTLLHRHDIEVTVWSDHQALLTRHEDKLTPRQARWNETIKYWMPTVRHVKGSRNPADFVSRWRIGQVGATIQA